MHQNGDEQQVGVVVIPLPAQGHLTQLLQLSHLLTTTYRIPVHYLCSASHIRQAKIRAHFGSTEPPNPTNSASPSIQFHDLQFRPFSIPPTDHPNTNKFPTHLQFILQSIYFLRHPISQFLGSISSKFKRLIVIHDSLMASVVVEDVKLIPNAESYTFHTSSAFAIFFTMWEFMVEKPFEPDPNDIPTSVVPSCQEWSNPEFEKFVANQYRLLSLSSGRLYNTCGALENRYMDLLKQLTVNENKKLFAIGPINHPFKASSKINFSKTKHRCLEWLDEQEKESVIYVSFGTTTSMSEEQIKELANGLEKSNQKFLWVLREADKVDIFKDNNNNNNNVTTRSGHQLPKGFEDKVKNKGLVVRDWAPQLAILGHPSIGGFLSHCGWNSCVESISMGVPIAAWPIHSDQPKNSILVTQVWKAGVVVRDWTCGGDGVVNSDVIEEAVRRLMASKEGQEIRERAKKLGDAVRGCVSSGGSSCLEMDAFVSHITR